MIHYFASALSGIFFMALLYEVICLITNLGTNLSYGLTISIIGALIGIAILNNLSKKLRRYLNNQRPKIWMVVFAQANMAFGAFAGLVYGLIVTTIPLFALYFAAKIVEGNILKIIFMTVFCAIEATCLIYSAYWYYEGTICYLEKKWHQ